jgi:flagellar protein FlgJ
MRAGTRYDVSPLSLLAQAAVESAWGGSFSFTNRNNPAGITAFGQPNAYWRGAKSQSSVSGLYFRIYPSLQDGFFDFARLIRAKYPQAAAVSNNPDRYARSISYSSYISEANGDHRPTYEANVTAAAQRIKAALGDWQPNTSTIIGLVAGTAFVAAGLYWQRAELQPAVNDLRRYFSLL